jgi:hypothetical protein
MTNNESIKSGSVFSLLAAIYAICCIVFLTFCELRRLQAYIKLEDDCEWEVELYVEASMHGRSNHPFAWKG